MHSLMDRFLRELDFFGCFFNVSFKCKSFYYCHGSTFLFSFLCRICRDLFLSVWHTLRTNNIVSFLTCICIHLCICIFTIHCALYYFNFWCRVITWYLYFDLRRKVRSEVFYRNGKNLRNVYRHNSSSLFLLLLSTIIIFIIWDIFFWIISTMYMYLHKYAKAVGRMYHAFPAIL